MGDGDGGEISGIISGPERAAQFAGGQNPTSGAVHETSDPATETNANSPTDVRAMLGEVKTLVRKQAEELESQRWQLERQQADIDELRHEVLPGRRRDVPVSEQEHAAADELRRPGPDSRTPSKAAMTAVSGQSGNTTETGDSPLSIRFGRARLTPGGWVDFTSYYRSTDVGSGLGTSFATIPYSNTVLGGLSETRFTAQGSRMSLRADVTFGPVRVFGYAEADFNGYLPSNAYVSTNSDSVRLRVYSTDLKSGRWELLAGQSWSMLTPNRVGVSPFLSEIYNTLHLDTN